MRVAVVHDWLTVTGGAERVLAEILALFPQADLYTLLDQLPASERGFLAGRKITTSFLQKIPFIRRTYRAFLPLMPLAVEQWDFSQYDLVISSSYAVVKGVITGPDTLHLSYIHSPMRYGWDMQAAYFERAGFGMIRRLLAGVFLHRLRIWDHVSSQRIDVLLANSRFVAGRIRKLYRRDAQVVHPPVDLQRFSPPPPHSPPRPSEDFFLTVSRLVPYKRVDLMVEAFAKMPDLSLVIIGDGPEMEAIRGKATPNIQILGALPDAQVTDYMQRCRAFLFAAIEDFGITPLEAQACGKPVIALAKGGALETLTQDSAIFYPEQTADALCDAVRKLTSGAVSISDEDCRANAGRFSPEQFRQRLRSAIDTALEEHRRLSLS